MSGRESLPARFADHVRAGGLLRTGDTAVVAVSGGLDSLVLLHLLRFHPPVDGLDLLVAHFDHAMRPGSGGDLLRVKGLALAWGVPVRTGRAEATLSSEGRAREARYAFLEMVLDEAGAQRLLTAHHADDQAETVLFRAVRGTGLRGLAAMRARGPGALVRPLLPFWREELAAYARAVRLGWREDPSNLDRSFARNALRHDIVPRLEDAVAPGARRALVRLALLARRNERAWRSLLPGLLDEVVEESSADRIVVARPAFLSYDPAVRARVLRALVRRLGPVPGEAGTRAALEFSSGGASGGRHALPGGLVLAREFDRLVLERSGAGAGEDRGPAGPVEIREPGTGSGVLGHGKGACTVVWSTGGAVRGRWVERFALRGLAFPLRVRRWIAGDRIRLSYGTKKLKKLFSEARIPRHERARRPVLVDGQGRVLWVPGVALGPREDPADGGVDLTIGITDADDV